MTTSTSLPVTSGAQRPRPRFASDAARWRAVEARDAHADGAFVFAVRTTGVYCRPSCPSRRARRENVRFFDSCNAAEYAGFRACRRCVPKRASAATPMAAAVADACRKLVSSQPAPSLDALAREAGYSPAHFHRAFRRIVGVTPRAYADAHRIGALRDELAAGESVTSAIAGAGFASTSRVYGRAGAALGMTPREFRRGGQAQDIRYAFADTPLGVLVVATTDKGVCAIELGASRATLARGLRERFVNARRVDADSALGQHLAKVVAFVDSPRHGLELPLDVRGTAFQHRVWTALQAIAPGERTTYSEIARKVGAPGSVRAVARAIATNPIALAIPCHRVIAKSGKLAGYRWGVERKAALLELERNRDER